MKSELLIGCGSARDKRLTCDGTKEWSNLTTLDYNQDHKPDMLWDLNCPEMLPEWWENEFDEIHAYEVLEHLGQQGDYRLFFRQFEAIWRVLKPNGHLLATVPSRHSEWAWGDPSHTRIVQPEQLIFLSQPNYENVGKTPMSDFRHIYKADFDPVYVHDDKQTVRIILKAIKPARISS
jgi:predicted SAM-dependent methyltransferase